MAFRPGGLDGLSPRVRGNHSRTIPTRAVYGSIPACAGEPRPRGGTIHSAGVYPRVCGGTILGTGNGIQITGLSPRVRGNHHWTGDPLQFSRSIPACAGEPTRGEAWLTSMGVYPRVCGGTIVVLLLVSGRRGLSPRVRGNLSPSVILLWPARSIPACAGEPRCRLVCSVSDRVYPRVCGGTISDMVSYGIRWGLSPRVRGNLRRSCSRCAPVGSIPACAGEPSTSYTRRTYGQVYPRVCGGTCNPRLRRRSG